MSKTTCSKEEVMCDKQEDVKELPTATPLLDNHARSSSMGGNGGATAISKKNSADRLV